MDPYREREAMDVVIVRFSRARRRDLACVLMIVPGIFGSSWSRPNDSSRRGHHGQGITKPVKQSQRWGLEGA